MNHLQRIHFEMAMAVESILPRSRRTGIDTTKVTTDQAAQHYSKKVYAHAAGFPTPKGRKCGC